MKNANSHSIKMYHNPRCSKSLQTLRLLQAQGIDPKLVDYLNSPPNANELRVILENLGINPRQLLRTKEKVYKSLQLSDINLSDEELIEAMVENPVLIERPIVINGHKAAIGRPPEQVLEIL